jgi:hypothetical protein
MKRNWKKARPTSLLNALELCVEYAREVKNAGVPRIAEYMGEKTHHTLYKYLEDGGLPARKLRAFENACGICFVTRWLAMSAGLLVIDIPTGRSADGDDVMALQETLNDAVGALLGFYAGKTPADEVLTRITAGMEGLAFHRENVRKFDQPELGLQ